MDAVHVPYQSTSQQVLAAAGGHLHFTFDTPGNARGLVESGKLRPLAVTGPRRTAFMPDVPTFEELGYRGFDLFVWNGLMAPAGTPAPIIAALNREALVCQQKAEVKARMEAGSYEQGMLKPDEFATLIDKDLKVWTEVVRETGVQIKS
jgi:tripartite-type tricarboxylate transporter receptor subunit TctC